MLTAAAPSAAEAEPPYFAYSTSKDGTNQKRINSPTAGQCTAVSNGNWANNQSGLFAHLYTDAKCKKRLLTMEDDHYTLLGTGGTFYSVKFTKKKDEW
ncbi:hypothetical protein ACTWQF_10675 [Streptomyces sp. 8N114]|uniref:hypothetical protein n=1 Tax=Streptomyces sp. 8N114 TaxID=3457419 RepID=UPI003FD3B787